jgi:hypothetical protein
LHRPKQLLLPLTALLPRPLPALLLAPQPVPPLVLLVLLPVPLLVLLAPPLVPLLLPASLLPPLSLACRLAPWLLLVQLLPLLQLLLRTTTAPRPTTDLPARQSASVARQTDAARGYKAKWLRKNRSHFFSVVPAKAATHAEHARQRSLDPDLRRDDGSGQAGSVAQ